MACPLAQDNIWVDKPMYDEAEKKYFEKITAGLLTPLAGEVAKARQRLSEIKDTFNNETSVSDNNEFANLKKMVTELSGYVNILNSTVATLEKRVKELESKCGTCPAPKVAVCPAPKVAVCPAKKPEPKKPEPAKEEDDDDVDLFGSDSEDDEAAAKIKEERLAAYAAKKAKKPALIAKSNIILDVKPWDDETDMKAMEQHVRKIECDGLLWGAAKLVPLAYGIHKLQISCVVEDDKVSIDWLQEQIESIEDFVQSVDIAAFNKV